MKRLPKHELLEQAHTVLEMAHNHPRMATAQPTGELEYTLRQVEDSYQKWLDKEMTRLTAHLGGSWMGETYVESVNQICVAVQEAATALAHKMSYLHFLIKHIPMIMDEMDEGII